MTTTTTSAAMIVEKDTVTHVRRAGTNASTMNDDATATMMDAAVMENSPPLMPTKKKKTHSLTIAEDGTWVPDQENPRDQPAQKGIPVVNEMVSVPPPAASTLADPDDQHAMLAQPSTTITTADTPVATQDPVPTAAASSSQDALAAVQMLSPSAGLWPLSVQVPSPDVFDPSILTPQLLWAMGIPAPATAVTTTPKPSTAAGELQPMTVPAAQPVPLLDQTTFAFRQMMQVLAHNLALAESAAGRNAATTSTAAGASTLTAALTLQALKDETRQDPSVVNGMDRDLRRYQQR